MNEFYQGLVAGLGMLGGLCAFNYWVFNLMEKRLEIKLDVMNADIHRIVTELREDRLSKDRMYQFVLDHARKDK